MYIYKYRISVLGLDVESRLSVQCSVGWFRDGRSHSSLEQLTETRSGTKKFTADQDSGTRNKRGRYTSPVL